MSKPTGIGSRQSQINQSYNTQTGEYSGKSGAMPKSHEKQIRGNSIYFASSKEQTDKMLVSEKEQDLIEDVRFVSSELKKVAVFTLDKIFSD